MRFCVQAGLREGLERHPVCLLSAPGLRVQKTGKTWEKRNYPRACGRFCLSSPMWQRRTESTACLRAVPLVIATIVAAAHRINHALVGRFYLLTPLRWWLTESTVRLQGGSRMRQRRFAMKGESIACLRAILLVIANAAAAHRIIHALASNFAYYRHHCGSGAPNQPHDCRAVRG